MKVKTACTRDCPDACGLLATVEDGRIVRLEGDPEHPVTRGFLCYRTHRFLERHYDPDRLTTPWVRDGGDLRPATWDEALDRVATTLRTIRAESGPAAILHYRSGGSLGLMKHVVDAFFEAFGPVTIKSGDVCSGAGEHAQETDLGVSDSHDLFDLRRSRTIVLWGKNPFVSSIHLVPLLRECRAAGARLAQIDPVRHRGADLCDVVLQPRPGGDIALGLGVARRLFETRKTDPHAAAYCDHLDDFRALACGRTLAGWAEAAGVSADEVVALADAYADGPAAILVGWGMQRRTRGSDAVRVLDALAAVSGNLGVPGGGVSFYFRRRGAFDTSFSRGLATAPRAIPEPLLGRGIVEADDPPIRAVWVTAGNPVAMLPDSRTVRRALESRELTVVVDSHWTDTARAAHVVLPAATMLEDDDLVGAYGHHWLAEVRPVLAPVGEARTDHDIVRALAARLGVDGDFARPASWWKERMLARVAPRGAGLADLAAGAVRNPEAPEVLFADRRFPTPTGRVNLIRETDPDPPRPPADRPLLLAALSTERAQASQWPARTQSGPVEAIVHPDAAPGFADGDRAHLESEIDVLEVVVRLDPRQRTDVAIVPKGGWLSAGRCANALVPARTTDHGQGAVYYDTPVRLVPVRA